MPEKNNFSSNKAMIVTVFGLMALLIILVIVFICSVNNSLKNPLKAEISNKELILTGFNNSIDSSKTIIDINDITKLSLNSPPVTVLTNNGGGQSGSKIYGDENIKGFGNLSCYIENNKEKYIFIKTNEEEYIINFLNFNETISIFNQLKVIDDRMLNS